MVMKSTHTKLPHFIYVGRNCNNNCVFCSEATFSNNQSTHEIKKELLSIRQKHDSINFMGREPSLRKDILELVGYSKKLGFKRISMTTNGRMFAYLSFTRQIVRAGLTDVVVSIHGHNAELHDCLTRTKNSFDEAVLGIRNLHEHNLYVMVNVIVLNKNYKHLQKITDFLHGLGIKEISFLVASPTPSIRNREYLVSLSGARRVFEEVIRNNPEMQIWIVNMPFCLMENYKENLVQCLEKTDADKIKFPKCKSCCYDIADACGVWKDYIEVYGDDEIMLLKEE
jgi:cyclic pyranopterin phosphate synthase